MHNLSHPRPTSKKCQARASLLWNLATVLLSSGNLNQLGMGSGADMHNGVLYGPDTYHMFCSRPQKISFSPPQKTLGSLGGCMGLWAPNLCQSCNGCSCQPGGLLRM